MTNENNNPYENNLNNENGMTSVENNIPDNEFTDTINETPTPATDAVTPPVTNPVNEYPAPQRNTVGYYPYPYASGNNTNPDTADNTKKPKKTKEKKKHHFLKIAVLVLVCSILSGTIGAAISGNISGISNSSKTEITNSQHQSTVVDVKTVTSGTLLSAAEVYAANVNATVGITTSITTNYFGWTTSSAASGSGFIISEDGYIITNYHVIENNDSVTVTTYDNTKYSATVVGCDKTNDIAVLKIDATGLSCVKIGNSENMNVGDDVVAIGNPLGELTFSLTKGTVSALNRDVTIETGYTMKLIQTDCAINSGNSGGALFNMYGEVIGITNAKYSSSSSSSASIDNIAFAIPMNSVYDIIKGIIETGTVTRRSIGVSVTDLGNINRFYANYNGAVITAVEEGSAAENAGLKVGDIITAVNGDTLADADSLEAIVRSSDAGDVLSLTVYRSSEKTTINVTVEEKQVSATTDTDSESNSQYSYSNYYQFN